MRASIRQVAELAQVSPMTVSRVLRGNKTKVSEETADRVLAAVRELNYIPVRSSVQNRHSKTGIISLVPHFGNITRLLLDSETFEGLCAGARAHGYDLLIMLKSDEEWMANREEVRFLDRRSDGFVFVSPGLNEWEDALHLLVEHGFPAVVCYRRTVPEGIAWVDPDNAGAMRLAVDCLAKRGHREIAYLAGPVHHELEEGYLIHLRRRHENFDDLARKQCYEEAMEAAGLSGHDCILEGLVDSDWKVDPRILKLIRESGVTAVICCNDFLGVQLMDIAREAGWEIPGDLSVVGVDDNHARDHGMTTIEFGYDEVGRAAVEAWVEMAEGKPAEKCCKVVPVRLLERATVGAPRSLSGEETL